MIEKHCRTEDEGKKPDGGVTQTKLIDTNTLFRPRSGKVMDSLKLGNSY